MPVNFPSAPANNQVYTYGSRSWIWANNIGVWQSNQFASNNIIEFAAGSNTAPSITTSGDLNTGIFFPAADTIAFTEGGSEVMRIASNSNIGIGTTLPAKKLHVNGDIRLGDGGGTGAIFTDATNGLRFMLPAAGTNNTESMRLDSSGKVGIGTPSINSNYLQLGGSGQYSASLAVRQSRNSIEWGHPNQGGYGSVFGAEEPSGHSFIALNASNGTDNNTYKTWGLNGYVIKNDLSGPALTFNYVSNSNADNQTLTERMRINENGIITKPYQPAFYAYGGGTQSFSGAQTSTVFQLQYQSSLGSRSTGYNTSTYRFTAPVTGTYLFAGRIVNTTTGSTGPEFLFRVNGSSATYGAINYISNSYATTSGQIIIQLTASDYVEMIIVNNNSTTFTLDTTRSNFIGFLIG